MPTSRVRARVAHALLSRPSLGWLAAVVLLAWSGGAVHAQVPYTWTVNNGWGNAASWTPAGGPPLAADTAIFAGAAAGTIDLGGNRTIATVQFTPAFTTGTYTFNNNTLTLCAGYRGLTEAFTPDAQVDMNARLDRLRIRLNELAIRARAPTQFTGFGSMMAVHFCDGEIVNERDVDRGNAELTELFFFDLLARGFYIARRGMIVGSLVTGDAECVGLAAAVESFLSERADLLRG